MRPQRAPPARGATEMRAVFSADLARVLEREAARAGVTLSDRFDRDSSMRALFRCDHLPFLHKGLPGLRV